VSYITAQECTPKSWKLKIECVLYVTQDWVMYLYEMNNLDKFCTDSV